MYLLNICSICLLNKKDIKNLSDIKNNDKLYEKLLKIIPEMGSEDTKVKKQICDKCSRKIEEIYEFRQQCLKNKALFDGYIKQLNSVSGIPAEIKVNIVNIDQNNENNNSNIKIENKDISLPSENEIEDIPAILMLSEEIKVEIADSETVDYNPYETHSDLDYSPLKSFHFDGRLNPELEIVPWNNNINSDASSCDPNFSRQNIESEPRELYTCDICYRQFKYKTSLTRHILHHTHKTLFKCNVCLAYFDTRTLLNEHEEKICGITPTRDVNSRYNCNFCEKTYSSKLGLEKHVRNHMGYKPYVCEVCKKGFNCPSHLKVHIRIHTGEKPYACSVCRKGFADNSNLTKHLAKYHS